MSQPHSLTGLVLLALVVGEASAEAYVDPGTASYTFQIIAGAVLGGAYLLRTYWNRVMTSFRSLVRRDVPRND